MAAATRRPLLSVMVPLLVSDDEYVLLAYRAELAPGATREFRASKLAKLVVDLATGLVASGYTSDILRRASMASSANSMAWFAEMVDARQDDALLDAFLSLGFENDEPRQVGLLSNRGTRRSATPDDPEGLGHTLVQPVRLGDSDQLLRSAAREALSASPPPGSE